MDRVSPHKPQRFGRYVLLDRMGAGGMAEVFRAVVPGAEGFRRELVLKRILADRASSPRFIEMFVHEARISALLHHPNIVQVFDFGQVDGSYFLAMELLNGRDLQAVMRCLRENRQKFPIPVVAHIGHEIAAGLSYAHSLTLDGNPLNIVHRDVSPSNVMCMRAGGIKVLDFGVAVAFGPAGPDETERPHFRGKISYAAPEYVEGTGQDARIDLFALGVILWEMAVGQRLFQGPSDVEKLRALLDAPIAAPSSLRPAVPAALDQIILRALERDPDLRYQTAAEMVVDLEQVVLDTKYQAHMLPNLLDGLFGPAGPTEAMAADVEELLQSGSIQAVVGLPSTRLSTTTRTQAVVAALAGMVAALGGAAVAAWIPSLGRTGHASATTSAVRPAESRPMFLRTPDVQPMAAPSPAVLVNQLGPGNQAAFVQLAPPQPEPAVAVLAQETTVGDLAAPAVDAPVSPPATEAAKASKDNNTRRSIHADVRKVVGKVAPRPRPKVRKVVRAPASATGGKGKRK